MICVAIALAALFSSGQLEGVLGEQDYYVAPVPTVSSSKLQIRVSHSGGSRRGGSFQRGSFPRRKIQTYTFTLKVADKKDIFSQQTFATWLAELGFIMCT